MDRVETGIAGLDDLMEGGVPTGFNLLVVGRPGTGKTILGLQYVYNGALKGENGLYITLDADADLVRAQGEALGWNIKKLEAEKKLCILGVPLNRQLRLNLFRMIEDKVKEYGVKRIVFDSLSSFVFNINQFNIMLPHIDDLSTLSKEDAAYFEEEIGITGQSIPEAVQSLKPDPTYYKASTKRIIYLVFRELSKIGTTNLIITSENEGENKLTVDGVSEFVSDSVIAIYNQLIGAKRVRTMTILKMRSTDHSQYIHDLELNKKGVTIKPANAVYG